MEQVGQQELDIVLHPGCVTLFIKSLNQPAAIASTVAITGATCLGTWKLKAGSALFVVNSLPS